MCGVKLHQADFILQKRNVLKCVISVSTHLECWGVPQFSFCIVSLLLFFCDCVTVIDNSLSITDCLPPDEEALASKACGNSYEIQ